MEIVCYKDGKEIYSVIQNSNHSIEKNNPGGYTKKYENTDEKVKIEISNNGNTLKVIIKNCSPEDSGVYEVEVGMVEKRSMVEKILGGKNDGVLMKKTKKNEEEERRGKGEGRGNEEEGGGGRRGGGGGRGGGGEGGEEGGGMGKRADEGRGRGKEGKRGREEKEKGGERGRGRRRNFNVDGEEYEDSSGEETVDYVVLGRGETDVVVMYERPGFEGRLEDGGGFVVDGWIENEINKKMKKLEENNGFCSHVGESLDVDFYKSSPTSPPSHFPTTLTCHFSGNPKPEIEWFEKCGQGAMKKIDFRSDECYSMFLGDNETTLKIENKMALVERMITEGLFVGGEKR